ncbi:MAG: PEP/pyruvate-binding domain-containing protein [Desulfomonilaceae bacterium]
MPEQWIYWFEELGSEHNDLVGKKCANLGELTKLGLRVPPGFAISVDAYEKFMAETGAGTEVRRYVQSKRDLLTHVDRQVEAGREIRGIIESKKMPSQMMDEIHRRYEILCGRTGMPDLAVAVRSSGAVSMPGQMETFLNVKGKADVIQKVIQVWGSAFTTRAIAFRLEKGMDVEKAPIGVAVLKMVNARCAGVALTVLPTTGDMSKIIVEGNWGLGESVVSGEMTPDQFIVDKACGEFECTVSTKKKMICRHTSGTQVVQVPKEMQCRPCLEPDELQEIARIAKQVESHFDLPQDMEWVIDEDLGFPESILWVQTRPAKYSKKANESEYLAELMSRVFKV